MRGVSKV